MEPELIKTIQKIEKHISHQEKNRKLIQKSQRAVLKKATVILGDMKHRENRILEKIQSKMNEHSVVLSDLKKIMESADETLCNVLLAIRQNEYLQAWYPAQNGSAEQKVTGKYAV